MREGVGAAQRAQVDDARELTVGYLVSRFPALTETFVLRELAAVDAQPGVEVTIMSLYAPPDRTVHAEALPWVSRAFRPGWREALAASAGWLRKRPLAASRVWGRVAWEHRHDATVLAKALSTAALGFAHARHAQQAGVGHIHAHFAWIPGLAAWVAHRMTGVPYSLTAHAHDIFSHQYGLATRLRDARFVVAVSRYHWMFLQHFGADPRRLELLYYGLDLGAYAFRARAIPADGPVDVLFVSSLREYKGHRYLLQALADDPRLERLRVELVGGGPLRAELEQLAAGLGLAGRVTFAGPRDQGYVRERLTRAPILVQPSVVEDDGHTEGLPNTLIEAAACGATMVASGVTGIPDLIRDGETGFLAEPRDPASLADALGRALACPDVEAVQRRAREHVEAHHDMRRVSARLAALFRASAATPG